MTNVRKKASSDSPKTEVGEVDTRAPFQSVKAAVTLFGEVAVSRGKQSSSPATSVKKKLSEVRTYVHLHRFNSNSNSNAIHVSLSITCVLG